MTLPKTSTLTYGLHSFSYKGSITWNNTPDVIKNVGNSSDYKI